MQVFIGIFTYMIYLYGLKHTNPSTFKLHKPNDINELNESANISKKFDDSIPHNFTKQTATINAFQNGEVIIHNDVATWTFKSDKDVISEEAIELYKKYGGMVDNNKDITIYVSKYNNEKLDKNQYISDCGNYIFKPDYI